ncbi:hypothetical protein BV22DRAFT_777888 [Leucogyrophana mollusca]|uniref:Uncharacterized protein n=1 Tax=Leucogyrophana mollusca TaxID=85980 RepID=A0ACB8B694_9AGAM|nr:hypothetical protein BV22DRAFT_777888 [Leucogyrophana mollusca]
MTDSALDTATSLTEAQSTARQTVEDIAVGHILAKLAAKRGSRSSSATDPSADQSKAKHPVKPRASKRKNATTTPEPVESDGEDGAEKPSSSIAQGPSALLSRIIASRGISKGSGSNLLPCPVCLQEPFHVRYRCPVILGGPPRIRERLDELRKAGGVKHRELIEELEDLIPGPGDQGNATAQRPSSPGGAPPSRSVSPEVPSDNEPNSTTKSSSGEVLRGLSSPLHPLIPDGSHISEVTVESRDEGSSSDSSDEEEGAEEDSAIAQRKQEPTNTNPLSLENADLEAIMRGPTSSRSILDDIPSSDDNPDEPEEGKLEEEDADDRRFRRLSRRYERDVESSEERDAASPSGDHEDEDASPPLPATIDLENAKIASEQKATTHDAILPGREAENQGGACEQLADSADDTQVEPSIGTEDDTEVSVPGTTIPEKEPSSPVVLDVTHTRDEAANPEVDDDTELGAPDDQLSPDEDLQDEVDRARSPDPTTGEQKQDTLVSPQLSPVGISTAESHATPIDLSAEQEHQEDAADPIEPADDIAEPPLDNSVHDPIEVTTPTTPKEKTFVPPMSQSTPKPGVTKRMKNRGGKVPLSQLELPVSVLKMEAKDLVTPLPAKKIGRKAAPLMTLASQDSVARRTRNATRRSASVADDAPVSSTPIAVSQPITRGERAASKAAQTTKRTGAPEESNPTEPTVPMSDPLATAISAATPAMRQSATVPQSLDKWTVLAEPSSPSFMLDQLRSSSPQESPETSTPHIKPGITTREGDVDVDDDSGDETLKKEPLFILSQAQTPFPYSQWNGPVVPPKEQVAEPSSSTESESDNDLGVGSKVKATPISRSQKPAAPYRRLTDIASSQALFSQDILVPRSSPLKLVASTKKPNKYDDDDDDDEPSSDSDSDSNSKSHIPAGKRAGSGLQRKGGRGLSSFT